MLDVSLMKTNMNCISWFFCLVRFVDGMNAMGLAEKIRSHPEELKQLFVGGHKVLQLLDLFIVRHAEPGSNRRREPNDPVLE